MKKQERWFWIGAVLLTALFSPLSGLLTAGQDAGESHKYQKLLQSVFYYVDQYYVDEIDEKDLWIGAIRGILSATGDPYTRFLDREEHREFNTAETGQKVGIGVEITMKDGIPVVISPVEGSPADRAGILPGDRIVKVSGKSTESLPFGDLLDLISGEPDTVVELEIERRGPVPRRKIQITRGLFDLDYVYSGMLEGGRVGYLRLTHFLGSEGGASDEFRQALQNFADRKVRGVVLDLRNNAGGHLDMAVQLCGYFLKEGMTVVRVRGRKKELDRDLMASGETGILPEDVPVAVLINGGSASASEVMAGALQDYHRAKLVGQQSFGKGSVQQVFRPLPDDTAALITIQKYFTPLNRSIHGVGLTPDVEVEDLAPDLDESYALARLREEGYYEKFQKDHPDYGEKLAGIMEKDVHSRGLKLRHEIVLRTMEQLYPARHRGEVPDPRTDLQLAKALEVLGTERGQQ